MKKLKRTLLDFPHFKSEAEEAEWWDTHKAEVDDFIERAHKNGAVTRGVLLRTLGGSTQTTIRLPNEDLARAKEQAGRKGLKYQTYLKMVIHEALERAQKAS